MRAPASVDNTVRKPRHTYNGEEPWLDLLQLKGHVPLRTALIRSGVSATLAGQLVWFLEEQTTLERHLSEPSRTKYRRILAGLDPATVSRAIPG